MLAGEAFFPSRRSSSSASLCACANASRVALRPPSRVPAAGMPSARTLRRAGT